MFGTAIAVFDGYSRSVARIIDLLKPTKNEVNPSIDQDMATDTEDLQKIPKIRNYFTTDINCFGGCGIGILLYTDVLNPETNQGFKSFVDFTTRFHL